MPHKLHKFITLLSMLTFCFLTSFAEENAKPEKEKEKEKEKKVSGTITAGGLFASGNINKLDVKATGSLAVEDSLYSLVFGGKYQFTESDHQTKNKGIESNFKVDFFPYRHWSPLVAYEYIHNTYKGYNFRLAIVSGAKYNIYLKPKVSDYSVSLAGIYDIVDYTIDKNTLDDKAFRISLRPKIKQKIGNVFLIEKFYYQPRVNNFKDYLIKNWTEIECKIALMFYLSVMYEFDYRSVLPPIKENETYEYNDHALEVALKIKL